MRSLIKFKNEENNNITKLEYIQCDSRRNPESIWGDLVQAIKELKTDKYNEGLALSFDNLVKRMICFDGYSDQICEGSDWIDYYIYVWYEDTSIIMKGYSNEHYYSGIVDYENRYITLLVNEGNCIDDFLIRGIKPQLDNINDMVDSIKSRLSERQMAVEYHCTSCYEKDFMQISMIKKFAQKIVDNCNTQLERISEFYTKLN